jgi:hypothetical protein
MSNPLYNNDPRLHTPVEVSQVLPADVRDALVKASRVASPVMRALKIDAIYADARFKYPKYFKSE